LLAASSLAGRVQDALDFLHESGGFPAINIEAKYDTAFDDLIDTFFGKRLS
jgi:hypothetical protein